MYRPKQEDTIHSSHTETNISVQRAYTQLYAGAACNGAGKERHAMGVLVSGMPCLLILRILRALYSPTTIYVTALQSIYCISMA